MKLTHSKSNSRKRRGLSLSSTPRKDQQLNLQNLVSGFDCEKIKTDRRTNINIDFSTTNGKSTVQKKPSIAKVIKYETPTSKNPLQQQNNKWQSSGIKKFQMHKNVMYLNKSNYNSKVQQNIQLEKTFQRQCEQNQKTILKMKQNQIIQSEKIQILYRQLKQIQQKYKFTLKQKQNLKLIFDKQTQTLRKQNQALKSTLLQTIYTNTVKNKNLSNTSASKRINFERMTEIQSKLNQLILEIKK